MIDYSLCTVCVGYMLCFRHILLFFFFKQKTAYEMRISDWSSDVCSSDLLATVAKVQGAGLQQLSGRIGEVGAAYAAGSTPIQIFVAQMGRSTQATTLATGGAGRFTAAMGNPWTMIISTAAVVLLPLIENLFETEDAAKAAELASNGLSDEIGRAHV